MKRTIRAILLSIAQWLQQPPYSINIANKLKEGQYYWNFVYKNKVKVHQDIRGNFFITFEVFEKGAYITKYRGIDNSVIRQLAAYNGQDKRYINPKEEAENEQITVVRKAKQKD